METVFSCGFSLLPSQVMKFRWYDEEESDGVKIHEGKCGEDKEQNIGLLELPLLRLRDSSCKKEIVLR